MKKVRNPMKLFSFFSGIGAFEKALQRLGVPFDLVAYCDNDKYASKSYSAIHGVPESLNLGDITKVDETNLAKDVDVLTYGFPCTDISIAGKMAGFFDEEGKPTRSGLFFDAARIIKAVQPRVAIAENVKVLTSKKFAAEFKAVLDTLESAGYNNYWQLLNAKDYGVPQNRERVFIVSIRKDIDNGQFKFPEAFPLELRLKDVLEDEVDEKYYLTEKMSERVATALKDNHVAVADREPTVKQIGNWCQSKTRDNPNQGRIYDTEGISPTLGCMGCGNRQPFVKAYAATMRGRYNEAGVVEQQIERSAREYANTITSVQKDSLVETTNAIPKLVGGIGEINFGKQWRQGNRVYDANAIAMALTAQPVGNAGGNSYLYRVEEEVLAKPKMRIRKLTPKECFRLMDFDDEDYEKAAQVNSNTQLYKQAGNSIVVAVPMHIFSALLDCGVLTL